MVLDIRSTSQVISTFLASVVHASSIQHDGQDVDGRRFENVKICQLLFLDPHQDRHVIAMSRVGMRNRRDLLANLRIPSSGHVCIRIL